MIALNFPLDHTHPRRSIDFPEFQTQPRTRHSSYSLSTRVPNQSSIPCLESHFHKPLLLLSFPGYAARVLESADMKNHLFFLSFGTARKGLGTHSRTMGNRCWNRCRLRTCFRITLPAVPCLINPLLYQLLSVTPIVKNGFLVKLPLVRVLSFFSFFSFHLEGGGRRSPPHFSP